MNTITLTETNWISMTVAAEMFHISVPRFRAMLERELPPYAIETTLAGDDKRHFRINRTRLEAWLNAKDMIPETKEVEA